MVGAGGGTTVGGAITTTGGNTFHVTVEAGGADAEGVVAAFERWFTTTLEAEAIAVGGGEVPA